MRRVPRTSLLWPVLLGLVAALMAAPTASAVPRTLVYPNAVFTGGTESLAITTHESFRDQPAEVLIERTSGGDGPLRARLQPQGHDGTHWSAEMPMTTPDGTPAAPGRYDVVVEVSGAPVERCTACLTLLTRSAPGVRSVADVRPRVLDLGALPREVHVLGQSFAEGTTVEVLLGTVVDPAVTVSAAVEFVHGPDRATRITRTFTVDASAALGYRSLRFTNTDGRTTTCLKCLTITTPAESVSPTGATTDLKAQEVTVTVPPAVPASAKVALIWVGEGAPDPSRDLIAKRSVLVPGSSAFTGSIDFTRAKPGLHVYAAGYVLKDGSRHQCVGTCRFSVRKVDPPARPTPSLPPLDPDPELAPSPPSMITWLKPVTAQTAVPVSGGAEPGAVLDLFAMTRPAATYRLVRSIVVPANGKWSATVAPTANTTFYAVAHNQYGRSRSTTSTVLVRPAVALTAVRTKALTYRFAGRVTPRVPGQKVTLAYVTPKGPVGLASVPVKADGRFTSERRLPKGRAMSFVVLTGATADHAAGLSNRTPAFTVR